MPCTVITTVIVRSDVYFCLNPAAMVLFMLCNVSIGLVSFVSVLGSNVLSCMEV